MKLGRPLDLLSAIAVPTAIALAVQGSVAAPTPETEPSVDMSRAAVSYSADVAPIFKRSCVQCHGGTNAAGEKVVEYGLDLTSAKGALAGSEYGPVIEPGDPDNSYLVELIEAGDMPEEGDPLTPQEIEIIRAWIAAGAKDD